MQKTSHFWKLEAKLATKQTKPKIMHESMQCSCCWEQIFDWLKSYLTIKKNHHVIAMNLELLKNEATF